MTQRLREMAAQLPQSAGVYLFKNPRGKVLYVGKAVDLRARVRQYLSGTDERQMVPFLVHHASSVEVIVTTTEKEALLLENTLIKKHRPRFNVKLRDDSNYLHLRLDLSESWPRYRVVRRIKQDGARYFGPFASAAKARQTLTFTQRAYPLRTCSDQVLKTRRRPCLLHQMGRCVAPCVDLVEPDAYRSLAEASTHLLEGRTTLAMKDIKARMFKASAAEDFETAARWRDLMRSILETTERQQVVDPRLSDRDVWGLHRQGFHVAVAVLPIREGVMSEPIVQLAEGVIQTDAEFLSSAINLAYASGAPIPAEVLVPVMPPDAESLEDVLSERRGRRVRMVQPQRGEKVRLLGLARRNAKVRFEQAHDADARRMAALEELAQLLKLPGPPHRMECFDNSHLGGTHPVAAMAVFIDGRPDRAEYRNYKIKEAMGGDDYAGMREILTRRLRRCLESSTFPDLLVIDGGRGQVGVACAVLEDLGLDELPVIGLSKPRTERSRGDRSASDKIVLPHVRDPIRLPKTSGALRMLQYLRDETHSHAVTFQRKRRRGQTLKSVLEAIPGVGATRRSALLKHLGSASGVAKASVSTLMEVPGIGRETAEQIRQAFAPRTEKPHDNTAE